MKKEYREKIEKMGIGIWIIVVAIFFTILMIVWLIYNIFISSKG